MMYLEDVLELLKGFKLTEHPYMGKLDAKKENSIGIYNSKHPQAFKTAIGGPANESYGTKRVKFLIHGSKSLRSTEKTAMELHEKLRDVWDVEAGASKIKFIQLLNDQPVDVGTDDAGIHEMVIEAVIVYDKKGR